MFTYGMDTIFMLVNYFYVAWHTRVLRFEIFFIFEAISLIFCIWCAFRKSNYFFDYDSGFPGIWSPGNIPGWLIKNWLGWLLLKLSENGWFTYFLSTCAIQYVPEKCVVPVTSPEVKPLFPTELPGFYTEYAL